MKEIFICIVMGYLFGCIQTSYFISKFIKKLILGSLGMEMQGLLIQQLFLDGNMEY